MFDDHDVSDITPAQLRQLLDAGERLILLDVREPLEWRISNLEQHGAILIPMMEVPDRVGELDPEADIVVYCRTGARSDQVARFLKANGFARVRNLVGGINAWADEVDPGVRKY